MDPELKAMATIAEELEKLDEAGRSRVLSWAKHRFLPDGHASDAINSALAGTAANKGGETEGVYESFAELFDAARPTHEREKALVAGYWVQCHDQEPSFVAQRINDALKHLGHRVGNITDALDQLIAEKPSLVLQLRKDGTTKQARKTYKLTKEGEKRVFSMIRRQED